jgi:hypothetical protein
MSAGGEAQLPVITVTRGRPTPAELAAAVAVLLTVRAAGAAAVPVAPARLSAWADRSRAMHGPPYPGPHSWRASAWPRR